MLFDLLSDPHQQHDLATKRPDLCAQAAHIYLQWHESMMASMPDGATLDPMMTVLAEGGPFHAHKGMLTSSKYLEHLEKTDRAWAIPELKKRHPAEFEKP
jgi:hypothetical protein